MVEPPGIPDETSQRYTTNHESLIFTWESQSSHLWITDGPQKNTPPKKINIANGKNNHEWRSIRLLSKMVTFQQAMLVFWRLTLQTSSSLVSPLPFPPCQRTKDHAGYLTEVEVFGSELTGEACGVSLTTFTNLKKIQPCQEQDFWRFLLEVLSPGKLPKWMLIWKKIFGYVRNLQGIFFPFLGQEVSWNWCTTTWKSLYFLLILHHSESKVIWKTYFSYDSNPFKLFEKNNNSFKTIDNKNPSKPIDRDCLSSPPLQVLWQIPIPLTS